MFKVIVSTLIYMYFFVLECIPCNAAEVGQERQVSMATDTSSLRALHFDHFQHFSLLAFPNTTMRMKKTKFCDPSVGSYTGYIDTGPRHLFFYYFESRRDPINDDVILWTNGGPGGSSAIGLFAELGPCTIISSNETKYNPFSWNSQANIIFIDQPVGTGFSYADHGANRKTTEGAANDVADFLAILFNTFEEFKGKNKSFHLAGQSYAGRFLPVYASAVYDANAELVQKGLHPVNLQSVLIGNGATNWFDIMFSYYDIQCTNATGVNPVQSISTCVRMRQILPRCKRRIKDSCLDHFDLEDCDNAFLDFCMKELYQPYVDIGLNTFDVSKKCTNHVDCYAEETYIENYLNDPQIRKELGIDDSFKSNFTLLSFDTALSFYATGDAYHTNELYIAELLTRGIRVLAYAGMYDLGRNWLGNERWTLDMVWDGQEEFNKKRLREWFVDGKTAGLTRSYRGLTFATIAGAGHYAPHDKPVQALELLNRWISGTDL